MSSSPSISLPTRHAATVLPILWIILVLLLAGCASSAETSKPQTTTPTIAPTPTSTFTPTATSVPNPYPPYTGTLVWNDPLSDNSLGHRWDETSTNGDICQFSGSAYQVVSALPAENGNDCFERASNGQFNNFALQVTVTFLQFHAHEDGAGIIFRADPSNPNVSYYSMLLFADGRYDLGYCDPSSCYGPVFSGVCQVCHFGSTETNTLGLVANGEQFTFYVNGQQLASGTDVTFSQGLIGLAGYGYTSTAIMAYQDLKIWQL